MATAVPDIALSAPETTSPGDSPRPPQHREPRERSLWKLARLAVAIPLFLASIAALTPYTVVPVSSQAVVNARLSRVRAPREGDLQNVSLETGDRVSVDQQLLEIHALPGAVAAKNVEFERSLRDLEQRRFDVDARLKASQKQLSRYRGEVKDVSSHSEQELRAQLQLVLADSKVSSAKVVQAGNELTRDLQAEKDHLMPRSMVQQASDALDKAKAEVRSQDSQRMLLEQQIRDLQNGYLLGSAASSSAPLDKMDQASTESDQLAQEELAVDGEIAALHKQMTAQVSATSGTTQVRSPVSGVIWARAVAPGQGVGEGDDLFRIADASSIHVEVWLDRRYGPQLSVGDAALVYLSGMGKTLTGRVVSFQGTSRRRLDEEVNAIDLQPVHPDQYHVSIELDPDERKAVYIGQAAKVLFPGPKSEFRARLYAWLVRL